MFLSQTSRTALLFALVTCTVGTCGLSCSRKPESVSQDSEPVASLAEETETDLSPQSYEATAEQLLAARLDLEQAQQGWIRLFDGHTLFGWELTGNTNWRVQDGCITADSGDVSLLCTSLDWTDYELSLEFNASAETNSGVFLRTPLQPEDPTQECIEVNIAPVDNAFPTASLVGREKVTVKANDSTWRTMTMRLEGNQLTITLDGETVCEYTDPVGLPAGRIGLQKNSGPIAFRNVKLRPLGLQSMLGKDLDGWKSYPEMTGEFQRTEEGGLRVIGGKTQLETESMYGDFNLLAEYEMEDVQCNSGIFFRCIPGDVMMGYECQVNNEILDDNPLSPADCGAGGIFRRQDARVVAGDPGKPNTILLATRGAHFAAWVNGIQVTDVYDDRPVDENPRRGQRTNPGTIMIQGHDESTDATYHQLRIRSLDAELAQP